MLGDDQGLSASLRDDFRASGLYHLLAVSGQNVVLIVVGVLAVCWLAGIPRLIGELAALAAIGAYVLAVGPQPSVIRAGVSGALGSLAWIAARERDRWHFLLLGALVLLAWNPYTLLDAGFQLSFAAVAAIFVLVPPLERRLEGYPLPDSLRGAGRGVDGVRSRDRAGAVAPVPRDPAPVRAGERRRRARDGPAPLPRVRVCGRGADLGPGRRGAARG